MAPATFDHVAPLVDDCHWTVVGKRAVDVAPAVRLSDWLAV